MVNPYKITRHEFDGEKLIFFHIENVFEKNPNTNLYEKKGEIEKEWFRIKFYNWKDVQLVSNEVIHYGNGYTCSGKNLMDYFHTKTFCKLIESKELPNYDESPNGKSVQFGYYTYERWDLSNLVK